MSWQVCNSSLFIWSRCELFPKFCLTLGLSTHPHLCWGCQRGAASCNQAGCDLTSDWKLWTASPKVLRSRKFFYNCSQGFVIDLGPDLVYRGCIDTEAHETLSAWRYSVNSAEGKKGSNVNSLFVKTVMEPEPILGAAQNCPAAHCVSLWKPCKPPHLYQNEEIYRLPAQIPVDLC